MTARPVAVLGPAAWTRTDAFTAGRVALSLDLLGGAADMELSELVRDANVHLIRGGFPSLECAWPFCQASRILMEDDPTTAAEALKLGALVANAAVPGFMLVDVVRASFGTQRGYIGRQARGRGGVLEINGVLSRWFELTENGWQSLVTVQP